MPEQFHCSDTWVGRPVSNGYKHTKEMKFFFLKLIFCIKNVWKEWMKNTFQTIYKFTPELCIKLHKICAPTAGQRLC